MFQRVSGDGARVVGEGVAQGLHWRGGGAQGLRIGEETTEARRHRVRKSRSNGTVHAKNFLAEQCGTKRNS